MATAIDLANEKMEQIYADKKTKGYGFVDAANYPTETNAGGHNGFTRSVAVTQYTNYKQVVVTVSHPQTQDCVLTALVTNY